MDYTEKVVYRKGRYSVVKTNEEIMGCVSGSLVKEWFYDVYHDDDMVTTFLSLKEAKKWLSGSWVHESIHEGR